ncbi:hypothetical protein SynBIOSU31_02993 [Synechococcus sp. BIOS-U3-1]|nr:hypothetical protein SynBIOSU31_02993 [Synechococcus sp. BIOS-U3-1]
MKRDLTDMACWSGWLEVLPLDSFKITALLVNPPAQLWCRPQDVLVSFW